MNDFSNKNNRVKEELFFEFLILKGLKRIGKFNNKRYFERVKHEYDRMVQKKYIKYFLSVWEYVNYCKNNNIMVGPGRGSCGASLVAYCLGITDVDPIEHELLFTRFLSPIRRDAPDIDLDFEDNKREKVFEHLIKRYGEERCAKVATYSRFHPKGVLRDIGRIFNIPNKEINKVCSLVIERSGGDARAFFALTDTFEEFKEAQEFKQKYPLASEIAIKLEGGIRHKSSHAAAMVVSDKNLYEYAPINKIGGVICLEWEKQLVEDINLVKFDILGLKTLTVLKDACKSANIELPKKFNDEKVYNNIFKTANTNGVFQLGTVGMQKFSAGLNISSFQDLYDATTLFRPSCLHSGQASVYVNRKNGEEPVEYFHPILEPITKQTKGVILYQEQIMQIMNQVGCMSWATAEMARKVITKSKGKDAFNKMREEFVANANKFHKMPIEEAQKLYDVVSTFGSYGFNKAHAVEYSIISYWCAWLKYYYPQHFYKALLKYEGDASEIQKYLNDAKQNGFEIENPEINISDESYRIYNKKIYAGLNSIKGLGVKTAEKIIKNRPYESFEDFKKKAKPSKKILKGLIIADAFRNFNINKKSEVEGNKTLNDYSDKEVAKMTYELTDLKPKLNLSESFDFGSFEYTNTDELKNKDKELVFLKGIITDKLKKDKILRIDERHEHQFEKRLLYLNLCDDFGNIACQINPETFEKYKTILEDIKNKPVIVLGRVIAGGGRILVDMIEIVDGDKESRELRDLFKTHRSLGDNISYIISSRPSVSKNGNSYYRIVLANKIEGLCFKFKQKLFPGMKVSYSINKEPFINLKIIHN